MRAYGKVPRVIPNRHGHRTGEEEAVVASLTKRAREALEALGEDEAAVAKALEAAGARGRRCDPAACPLAVYVRRCVPGAENAVARPYHLVLRDQPEAAVALPAACVAFRHGFDLRRWPQLEEEDAGCDPEN